MPNLPICLEELHLVLQSDTRLIIDLTEGFQRAAVLIPFVHREKSWNLIFTRRTENVRHHKREISFPGGRFEDDEDKDIISTALREIDEELGIKKIHVIGLLDDLLTISKYVVTPVIGYIEDIREVDGGNILKSEIDYVLETPLSDLTPPDQFYIKEMTYKDKLTFKVPFFDYQGEIIWGATGRILVNLLIKLNLLKTTCRLRLMGRDLWEENNKIDDGLEYIDNLNLLNDD
ncbi:MAG: CoA pyrophosphatase [Candidatus Heimdallarchaeota archaeon]|nr:MAG: CoA pyrophosphatase [Candidatus Heimdallarchaeota archaeon]